MNSTGPPPERSEKEIFFQALAWSPDGKSAASGGSDGSIRIWDAETGLQSRSFAVGPTVLAVAFSPTDPFLAVGTSEGEVQVLDRVSGTVTRRFRTQGRGVWRLKFSPDGRKLASSNRTFGGFGRDSRVWSLDPTERPSPRTARATEIA